MIVIVNLDELYFRMLMDSGITYSEVTLGGITENSLVRSPQEIRYKTLFYFTVCLYDIFVFSCIYCVKW